jgi:hypothetical protein
LRLKKQRRFRQNGASVDLPSSGGGSTPYPALSKISLSSIFYFLINLFTIHKVSVRSDCSNLVHSLLQPLRFSFTEY